MYLATYKCILVGLYVISQFQYSFQLFCWISTCATYNFLSSFKDHFQSLVLCQFCDARNVIFFVKYVFHCVQNTALSKYATELSLLIMFSRWYFLVVTCDTWSKRYIWIISCSLFWIYQVPLQLILMDPKQPEVSSNFLFLVVGFASFSCSASTFSNCSI